MSVSPSAIFVRGLSAQFHRGLASRKSWHRFQSVSAKAPGDGTAADSVVAGRPDSSREHRGGGKMKARPQAQPSASVILVSPSNKILLLHRVQHSRAFPSAHVFPGGNLSDFHDGNVPGPADAGRHVDGPAYRLAAIRETFEECGILLARKKTPDSSGSDQPEKPLLRLPADEKDKARRLIHDDEVRFTDWLLDVGGVPDLNGLVPFTRWITPIEMPKRFTTQMYLYMLPTAVDGEPADDLGPGNAVGLATSDGGVENTAATFEYASTWVDRASRNEMILFPPQMYLLSLIAAYLTPLGGDRGSYLEQRERLLAFITQPQTGDTGDDSSTAARLAKIPWADKAMSPTPLPELPRLPDGRMVMGLDKPGPELEGTGRGGDLSRVVVVRFTKRVPSDIEVRSRAQLLADMRLHSGKLARDSEGGGKGGKSSGGPGRFTPKL